MVVVLFILMVMLMEVIHRTTTQVLNFGTTRDGGIGKMGATITPGTLHSLITNPAPIVRTTDMQNHTPIKTLIAVQLTNQGIGMIPRGHPEQLTHTDP